MLKALPVLVLGGFDSIPGAIVGGLIIGASEKLAEVYIGPFFGGGIEGWFAYAVALVFLLVRPSGLFGQKAGRKGLSDGRAALDRRQRSNRSRQRLALPAVLLVVAYRR